MALITDPDDLSQGTEVTINVVARTIALNVAGNLSNDGVTGAALYSFLKEEWKTDASLIPTPFPMLAIDNDAGKFVIGQNASGFNNWTWANDTTRTLIRSAGWQEYDSGGNLLREYIGVFSGSGVQAGSQPYYAFSTDTAPTPFSFTGPVDQGVQTFGNAANGNFDKRGDVLNVYVREQGNTYGQVSSTALPQLLAGLKPIFAPLTLTEATDTKITVDDNTIDTTAPYTGMSITYHATPQASNTLYATDLSGGPYNFGIVIDANGGTAQQVYNFVQRQLRKPGDIDADTDVKSGQLQDELLRFVGDRLDSVSASNPDNGGTGVAVVNFDANDTNSVQFTDNTGTPRTFPFVAAGSLNFNSPLVNDPDAVYRMFFTTNPAGNFGSSSAVIVQDSSGTPISGDVSGQASISFDFDYDGNVQGGRTAGTDANITIVAIGLENAQYVLATGTITRQTGLSFSLVSALERNYANAA